MKNTKNKESKTVLPIPLEQIQLTKLSDNVATLRNREYDASTLVSATIEQKCVPFDVPLATLDLSFLPFNVNDLRDLITHVKRIENVDITKPIIYSTDGVLLDGYHRVCRAVLDGKSTIKAVVLKEMPCSHDIIET